jgi:FAD:protein FMN transferase
LIVAFAILVLRSAPDAGEAALQIKEREMMGTRVRVVISNATPEEAESGFDAAFKEFERVEQVMNEWRPESPLSAINAIAGSGRFADAPEDVCEVLRQSLSTAKRTRGLFDPTWAALRELWRFGSDQTGVVPSSAEVKKTCRLVSYRNVEIHDHFPAGTGCEVRLKTKGMQLGFGGVAKGWGVDQAVRSLRARGFKDFLVQAGGDLYAAGKRGDRAWRVGIRDPRGPQEAYFARMGVSDAAFSTSGDYERYFIAAGKRYHHIIDPRTCHPAGESRSATILAPTAMEAEFLTKATFILGGQEALALADSWGAAAVLVTKDNRVLISKSLSGKLEYSAPTP